MDTFIFDKELQLKDAGAVTTSGAGTVGGAAKVLDLGAGPEGVAPDFRGDLVVDVTAIDNTDGNEAYTLSVQVSDASDFGSGVVNVSGLTLALDGRYVLPFRNEGRNGRKYRYLRVAISVGGTSPSIDYSAYVSKSHN